MAKVRIIEDGELFHAYIGNCDFWLNKQEMLDLYAAMKERIKL